MTARIVVVGGGGFYGRYLVDDLLEHTSASIVVARRTPTTSPSPRVSNESVDLRDRQALEDVVRGAAAVVHCAGPFERLPIEVLDAAIATGTPYIDIAENREYARLVLERDRAAVDAGVPALTGASVAPGLQLLFARAATPTLGDVALLEAIAAPDTRKHRGAGMFETMLYGAGRPFEEPNADGATTTRHGWTVRQRVEFPPPLGARWVYLVYGMADLDLLPSKLGPTTVRFWAGSEVELANRALMAAARVRARFGRPQWERLTKPVRGLSWLVGRFGRDEGGVIIEASGAGGSRRACIVGEPDGGRIPILLAAMAVEALLAGRIERSGVLAADDWTTWAEVETACHRRGLPIWTSVSRADTWRRIENDNR